MIINDKRENTNELPVKNIIQGNCFIHKDTLYIKTNASNWKINPNDCFCLRIDNGRLDKLDKETMVTPVETECNMITKNTKPTTEETTNNTTPSKYIVIMWTGWSERVWIESFNTEKEARNFMKENYNEITSPKNNEKVNETNFKEDFAYANVGYTDYFWQIEEIL